VRASNLDVEILLEKDKRLVVEYDALIDAGIEAGSRVHRGVFRKLFEDELGDFIKSSEFRGYSLEQLVGLHAAVSHYLFYSNDPELALVIREISDEIETREETVPATHLEITYESLIEARLFSEAAEFASRYRGNFVPALIDWQPQSDLPTGPAVIDVIGGSGKPTLLARPVKINKGRGVIVEAEPRCEVSRQLAQYLESQSLFEQESHSSLWVVRQGATIPLEPILDWNNTSNIDYVISYEDEAWPSEFTFSLTPVVSFLKDGKLVHQIVGWRGQETVQELQVAFESLRSK